MELSSAIVIVVFTIVPLLAVIFYLIGRLEKVTDSRDDFADMYIKCQQQAMAEKQRRESDEA